MSDLYFLTPEDYAATTPSLAVLTGAEAQHLTRVMRKRVGDEATLFAGDGRALRCEIASIAKGRVELTILETIVDDREPDVAVTALVALPKGDRQKWLLEKLTELGVRRFIPLDTERSDVKFDEGVRARLERQVLEASKQCGRLRLMSVLPSASVDEAVALVELLRMKTSCDDVALSPEAERLQDRWKDYSLFDELSMGDDALSVLAHPLSDGALGQIDFQSLLRDSRERNVKEVLMMIGPAGGFSHDEVRLAAARGWTPLDLGRQVYRVETAALVAATLFTHMH